MEFDLGSYVLGLFSALLIASTIAVISDLLPRTQSVQDYLHRPQNYQVDTMYMVNKQDTTITYNVTYLK